MTSCRCCGCKMVNKCCVSGCRKYKEPGISLHKFPEEAERRLAWAAAVNRPNWDPHHNTYICSTHFEKHHLSHSGEREGGMPTLFTDGEPLDPEGSKVENTKWCAGRTYYVGDFKIDAETSPEVLRQAWATALKKMSEDRLKIKRLGRDNERLRMKVQSLESVLDDLREHF